MSKFKQSLAISSAAALVAAGLGVSAPAYAAGEVTLAPTSGTNLGTFVTDEFSLTSSVVTASVSATNHSWAITDADQGKWYIKIGDLDTGSTTMADGSVTLKGRDELGNVVTDLDPDTNGDQGEITLAIFDEGAGADFNDAGDSEYFGEFLVDFSLMGATTIYITSDDLAGASNVLTLSPFDGDVNADGHEELVDVAGAPAGNSDEFDYGDGSVSATVQSWVEITGNYTTIDALYASAAQTVNWYDPKGVAVIPRVEQFISGGTAYLNDDTNANQNLGTSIQFAKSGLNLDQVDITKWNYNVTEADGTAIKATAGFTDGMLKVRDGLLERDDAGRLYAVVALGANVDKTKTYKMVVDHDGALTVDFGSVAVSLPTSTEEYHIEATVDQSTTNAIQTSHTDNAVELRPGVSTFKWTAQIKTDDDTVAKTASVPVLAVVQASSSYVSGTLTVSGTTETISSKSGYVIVNGFTDASGQWSVSVTSSTATAAVAYTISFYVVDSGAADTQADWVTTDDAGDNEVAVHTATYTAASASTLTADNSVLSGANVTVTFTAKDTYGVATALNGTKALSVELKSSNGTSYDKDVAVAADGTASFTFANYLTAGQSDVLTATLYTGTATTPTSVTTAVVTLYNAPAVSALQVPATASGNITYDDFITGKATTAAPAPNDGTMTITGTAVDANGAGIPGAAVLVESAGLQFVQNGGTVYAQDKITVVANAAGVFVVDVWAHKTNSTGFKINFTSGGKTASTTVKTYLPATGVDGNNLKFEVLMPANVVKNTTYAVTMKLTDKWGNPIATSGNTSAVSIQGVGSVQINSVDAATSKHFGKDGTAVVFLRSIKDIAGPGSVTATLAAANYSATSAATGTALAVAEIATDVTTTAWNETLFTNSISANVEVLESAAGIAKVNVGSFNGKLVVYANGYNGKRISWKVGGRWGSAVASSNTARFDRPTPRRGVTVSVEIYVDGVLQLTKSVLTR